MVPGHHDCVALTVPSADLPPVKAQQENTVLAGAQQVGTQALGLLRVVCQAVGGWGFGWHCPGFRQDGQSTHHSESLKASSSQICDLSLWAGGQKPTLVTLSTENKYE